MILEGRLLTESGDFCDNPGAVNTRSGRTLLAFQVVWMKPCHEADFLERELLMECPWVIIRVSLVVLACPLDDK